VAVDDPDPATIDLADAGRLMGGGAGLRGPADIDLLRAVGLRLGAATGGTRLVTARGCLAPDRQIGTSGVSVDPLLYVAFGISGAVQHTAGLGHPDHVVAVNLDPACPMMAQADLAVVADAPATLRALARRLGVSEADEAVEGAQGGEGGERARGDQPIVADRRGREAQL
jgi:electron transfer flavoprotein alpha subunit